MKLKINTVDIILAFCVTTQLQVHINCRTGTKRDRSHIQNLLNLDKKYKQSSDLKINEYIQQLKDIYNTAIKPVEEIYRFCDLGQPGLSEHDITAQPIVLLAGPWSTGKSTMVNYFVGIDEAVHKLRTGAEPTTSDFTVITGGAQYKTVEGLVLAADKHKGFSQLESFGQGFLERLEGIEMPYPLLDKVVFVDTPGIIENRKQQERGYPFNAVMKWFIKRADLIFVVFDPTKLDVGIELESLFKQLKGRESQIRLILNKADTISMQELMRVYGALFWSLAPLINVTEPPRVYIGSFWDELFKTNTNHDLFQQEEESLLHDLNGMITNQLENKIAFVRKHAIQVRIHALLVDKYLQVFNSRKSIFGDQQTLLADIVSQPEKYHIFQAVFSYPDISKYDLPPVELYKDFFSINVLNAFKYIDTHCSYFSGCIMDTLLQAIQEDLPNLLKSFKDQDQVCTKDMCGEEQMQP